MDRCMIDLCVHICCILIMCMFMFGIVDAGMFFNGNNYYVYIIYI